jgi:hypothetical protein
MYSLILFPAIVLIINIISALINKQIVTAVLLVLAFLFHVIAWGEDFNHNPFVTIYSVAVGAVCIGSKIPIDRCLRILAKNS